jgi:hypothetical protein
VDEHLAGLLSATAPAQSGAPVALQVTGPGGGQWQLHLAAGRVAGAERGLPTPASAGFHLSAATFGSLVAKELSVDESINSGRLVVQGAREQLGELKSALEQVVSTRTSDRTPHAMKA